jgi:lipoprotein LpqB-like beta-propeller protein
MRRQSRQNYVRGRVGRYLHAARSGHLHIRVPVAARSGRTQLRVLTAGRSGQVHARALTAARSVDTNSRLLTAARPVQTHSPVLTAPGFNHARIRTLVAVIAALTIALTACAGVPERSTPERVRAIGGSTATPVPTPTPQPGADPRAIVLGFLSANVSSLPDHNAAKGFLTPEARNAWSDSTVTIVDTYQVKLPDPSTDSVTVTANQVGSLDQNGIYRTVQQADSSIQRSFGMKRIGGQWRIDKLSPGLVIQLSDFLLNYHMHPLYYFDLGQKHLVPDPRYSPLADQSLATWLLDQLLSQPRPELEQAVNSISDTVNAKNATVTVDAASQLYVVELPGSSQLDQDNRRRLAAQVASTFNNALITITDNRREVSIPGVTGPFTETDFQPAIGVFHARPAYYVNDAGMVVDQTGKVLDGPLGHRSYNLTSISLAGDPAASDLRAAGVAGLAGQSTLLTGTSKLGLRVAKLPAGTMSRPAWAPGLQEVWLGYGASLLRVPTSGTSSGTPSQVAITGRGSLTGLIRAVRFSPDGTRIALVIGGSGRVVQCVVGTVERNGSSVRIDNLVVVTPSDMTVTDAAWADGTTLYVTGRTDPSDYGVWSVQSDGSAFSKRPFSNLPAQPESIAASSGELPWVASGGGVFIQRSNVWSAPFGGIDATVRGRSPIYLE